MRISEYGNLFWTFPEVKLVRFIRFMGIRFVATVAIGPFTAERANSHTPYRKRDPTCCALCKT